MRVYLGLASECNMGCSYCYRKFLQGSKAPPLTLLDLSGVSRLLDLLKDSDSNVQLVLHGNEPLVAGITYLKKLFTIIHCFEMPLAIKVQSNLTLLTKETARLFRDNDVTVGVSLDGPRYVHDANRKYLNGSGTIDDVMRGVSILKEQGVDVYAVCIYTKYSLGYEEEIYEFFKGNALNFQFGPVTIPKSSHSQVLALNPDECAHFYNALFDLYFFDKNRTVRVINIDTLIGRLLYSRRIESAPLCCNGLLFLDFDGFLYRCGRFAGDHRFSMGHVMQFGSYEALIESPSSLNYERRIRQFSNRCHECDLSGYCTRGCYYDAFISDTLPLGLPYCEFYKAVAGHVVGRIHESMERQAH